MISLRAINIAIHAELHWQRFTAQRLSTCRPSHAVPGNPCSVLLVLQLPVKVTPTLARRPEYLLGIII